MSDKNSKKKSNKTRKSDQKGGAPSGYSHFWYSSSPSNIHTLSKYTADHLENSPMFNPLKSGTEVATPTSGLIPTGVHLGNGPSPSNYYRISKPIYLVGGGKKEANNNNNWVNFVKAYANKYDLTFKEALTSRDCQERYKANK